MSAAVANGEVFTTGSWYYRLGRAVTAGTGTGATVDAPLVRAGASVLSVIYRMID